MCKILVVDSDKSTISVIKEILDAEGYRPLGSKSGREALTICQSTNPDLLIVDMDLPDLDGVSLVRQLRSQSSMTETPIIFLTEENAPDTVARALNAGADDCVRKPFENRELAARVRAHLRRARYFADTPTISVVPDSHQVFVNQREVTLTRVEFDLLRYLCRAPYQWHTTSDLLTNVWQYPNGVGDAALVRNHIRNLRRKLEDNPDRPDIIQSRHGRGYFLKANVQFGVLPG